MQVRLNLHVLKGRRRVDKLQAPAVNGGTNVTPVAFLAETLRVPKAAVSLFKTAGEASHKQVQVQRLDGAPGTPTVAGARRVMG